MVEKAPGAFRTISEVAETLDVPAHVLRFWESRFTQIKPVKRGGGRRYYRPADVDLIRGIRTLLYSEGMTIKGAQKVLREKGVRHVMTIGQAGDGAPPPAQEPPTAEEAAMDDRTEIRPESESDLDRPAADYGAAFARAAMADGVVADLGEGPAAIDPEADMIAAREGDAEEPDVDEILTEPSEIAPENRDKLREIIARLEQLRDRMRAP